MQAVAKLKNLPISPRKVRLMADLIRGASATQGLAILKHAPKKCSIHLEKLLLSAVANWEHKNAGVALEEADLRIKEVWVDGAGMLKRLRPAPQGRAHRIRKRASHITLIVDGTKRVEQPVGMAKGALVKPTNQIENNTDGAKS
jgi:large subunit ribosomal protein L22